tara:strand:+ start:971 stop:1213 length:243 start_codon:yes stop_codon:yes gene_type:complete
MQYFINILEDKNQDFSREIYLLGEQSFKVFWAGSAFNKLEKMVVKHPEFLDGVNVLDDKGNTYSVEEFLDKIKKLQIRTQ